MATIDDLLETVYDGSNGHVTDDVTSSRHLHNRAK